MVSRSTPRAETTKSLAPSPHVNAKQVFAAEKSPDGDQQNCEVPVLRLGQGETGEASSRRLLTAPSPEVFVMQVDSRATVPGTAAPPPNSSSHRLAGRPSRHLGSLLKLFWDGGMQVAAHSDQAFLCSQVHDEPVLVSTVGTGRDVAGEQTIPGRSCVASSPPKIRPRRDSIQQCFVTFSAGVHIKLFQLPRRQCQCR